MSAKSDPGPRWEAWREAEASLADPAKLDKAAGTLPARQGWILRAMATLDRGDRAEIEELALAALEAGQRDLVCVLRLTLLDPGKIRPTDVRSRAKKLGIPNGPGLPTLDLIRLLAVALAREQETRPQSLAKASRKRPVLAAVLMTLSSRFTPYVVEKELRRRSPRLANYWAAGCLWRMGVRGLRRELQELSPGALARFPEEQWPDLGESVAPGSLEDWLASSPPPPWSPGLDRRVERACAGASREERRHLLGSLLIKIDELLQRGRPADALGPANAAFDLAASLEGLAHRNSLQAQLAHLIMRLEWWRPDSARPIDVLETLWRDLRGAPRAERLAVARQVLQGRQFPGGLPRQLRGEMAIELILGATDFEGQAVPALLEAAEDIPRPTLERALSELKDRPGAERLLGLHELEHDDCAAALNRAVRIFSLPGGDAQGTRLAQAALQQGIDPTRRAPRRFRRAFESLLEILVGRDLPIRLAAVLLVGIEYCLGKDQVHARLTALEAELRRTLDTPRGPDSPELADEIMVLAALEEDERGRRRIREIARYLRTGASEPATWKAAIELAARLTSCPQPRLPLVQSALDGTSAFLLQRGPAELVGQLRAQLNVNPALTPLLACWAIDHADQLDEDPFWDELHSVVFPTELLDSIRDELPAELLHELERILPGGLDD